MKTTKIKIKNLFGIKEAELDGRSVEITGTNGSGKTSVIDSIRYALTNQSGREFVVHKGENEGEIFIETDSGLYIDRKKRSHQADYKSVKENGREVSSPETVLRQLFTPLQLDPVAFTQMDKKEQNRVILDLIDFPWDLSWIKEQFGEIPQGVNYEQNILQILNDIQSESGDYFQRRQDLNRDIRNKKAFIENIAKDIPAGYQAEVWEDFDCGAIYKKIKEIQDSNARIQKCKMYKDSYENKVRGITAEKEIAITEAEKEIAREKEFIKCEIERLKGEIKIFEEKYSGLEQRLDDKVSVINAKFAEEKAKIDSNVQVAEEYYDKEIIDYSALEEEVNEAEEMKSHLNEYNRMKKMQAELKELTDESAELTRKIELARNLPGEILKTATIPIDGFSVENGMPLINGLPVSNLSEGEQLTLCVDVALSKPDTLQIILIDGTEKLSDENREKLYQKCKDSGIQFIATRTTNDDEMVVHYL